MNKLLNQLSTIADTSFLIASYQDLPNDSLTGKEAFVSPLAQFTSIFIQPEASIEVVNIQLDDTLSTNQIFTITATIEATPQVGQRTAELIFPPPFDPMMPMNSPALTSRSTPSRATTGGADGYTC